LSSCTSNNSPIENLNDRTSTPTIEKPANSVDLEREKDQQSKGLTVKAKFIKFELGDASHFMFEDAKGKSWDFGSCRLKTIDFSRELDEKEANEENQGWGSNKSLQGKWFLITYSEKEQELYPDGEIGTVKMIEKAVPVEE